MTRAPLSDHGETRHETRAAWLLAGSATLAYLLPLWVLIGLGGSNLGAAVTALGLPWGVGAPWLAAGRRGWVLAAIVLAGGLALGAWLHVGSGTTHWVVYILGITLGTLLVSIAATWRASFKEAKRQDLALTAAGLWLATWGTYAAARRLGF
jgi:hypothetical protein